VLPTTINWPSNFCCCSVAGWPFA